MGTKRHIRPEELSAFVDGELAPARSASVRSHVAGCGTCAGSVAAFEAFDLSLTTGATCAALRPWISAFADGELGSAERQQLVPHLASCVTCQRLAEADRSLDARLAALPTSVPSRDTDAAIAAIVARGDRAPHGLPGLRLGAPARLATVAAASFALLIAIATLGAMPGGQLAAPPETVLVAAAQEVVFDARTNTLYVLDPKGAVLSVLNGTTHAEQARIVVGGKPTALALNTYANTVLVLDGTEKRLTEIDTTRNTVLAASPLGVSGTVTSATVDTHGQIVVSSVLPPAASTTAKPSPGAAAAGQVTVLDGSSKQVKSVRTVDVAPRTVALDPTGQRALLVSAQTTTVTDAATYRSIEQLPGGLAAVFDSSGRGIAILSGSDVSTIQFFGTSAVTPLQLPGSPLALIALPDGGFAVLFSTAGAGHVALITSDGRLDTVLDAAANGRDLAYDATTKRFAVVGGGGVSYPVAVAPLATQVASGAGPNASNPGPTTPAQRASASPSAAPTASTPVAVPSPSPVAGPARFAALAWSGTYRLELPNGRKAVQVAGSGSRIWFLDQYKALGSINTDTGKVSISGQLPQEWNYGQLLVGGRLVVAIDQTHGQIAVYDTALERLTLSSMALTQAAHAFALAPDERLWMGGPGGTLVAIDLVTKRIESVDIGATAVSALWVDSGGRVWYADDARKMLGSWDGATHRLSESFLPRAGNVVSLVTDGAGTLWVGTDVGEAIPVRPNGVGTVLRIGGLLHLSVDPAGQAWYFAVSGSSSAFAPLSDLAGVQLAPSGLLGPAFDRQGSIWLADPPTGGFYIVTRTAGRQ